MNTEPNRPPAQAPAATEAPSEPAAFIEHTDSPEDGPHQELVWEKDRNEELEGPVYGYTPLYKIERLRLPDHDTAAIVKALRGKDVTIGRTPYEDIDKAIAWVMGVGVGQALAAPALAVGASPQTVFDGECDAQTLLRKYKKLCMEIKRGDGYHLARIDKAIAALAAVGAGVQPVLASLSDEPVRLALDALEEIALAGMSGTGQESEEGMQAWHARRAWEFIGIAARARDEVRAALASSTPTKGGQTS